MYEISNDNGVKVLNFATSKNLTVNSAMFRNRNVRRFTERLLMETFAIEFTAF
jgi:hypothetical protein